MDLPSSLRSAGNGLTSAKNKVVNAARGLRMPGIGAPTPVTSAAPLPTIDPAMAARPAPVPTAAPSMSMRAPVAPIPTLTEVLQPGMGPNKPVPTIPTLTDVHTPGVRPASAAPAVNPNVAAGGMSAERTAFDAARTAAPAAQDAGLVTRGLRAAAPALGVLGKASGVVGAGMGAYNAATGVMEGDMQKAGLGAADVAASGALLTPAAPIAGTYLGIRAGAGLANAALSDDAKDTIGGTINAGLLRADSILGTHWGIDDSAYLAQKAAQSKPAPAPVPAAAATKANTADDIAAFNARMNKVGAPSISMRVGEAGGDSREIGNTQPASADMQGATAQNMSMRSSQQASADAGYARDEARRQADIKMQTIADRQFSETPQGAALAAQMDQARQPRIGASPVAPPAVIAAQQAQAQRDFEATKGLRMQGAVAMRGQDTTADDARLTQQTALINGMRAQQNADRQYGLDVNKQHFEQDKQLAAEKDQRDKAMAEKVAGMIPPGPDGKPDAAAAAQHMLSINAYLGERKTALEQHLALNPNDGGAKAELNTINKGSNDDAFLRKMVLGQQMKGIVANTATGFLNPRGTSAVNSDAPITSMRAEDGWFGAGTNYRTNRGDVIPGRYVDKTDPLVGNIGGVPNRNFDILKEKK